ncbi:MAG: ribonuclease HI family protein [Leptospiraceae bacterium]
MDSETLFPEPKRYLYCDGASKGNPGPASIGAVIYGKDPESDSNASELLQISKSIGRATNNVAEYRSLLEGLKALQKDLGNEFGHTKIHIRMDSQLVIRQIEGQYRVKNESLKPLYQEALSVLKAARSFKVQHIPRELNKRADALANEALK